MKAELIKISEHLYRLQDTCNVYLITDGDAGLLIDSGSGAILNHLEAAGVKNVEWVLHTHHHRDQCSGTPQLRERGARVAVPEYERHLFDRAELFWQTRRIYDNYDDRNNFFAGLGLCARPRGAVIGAQRTHPIHSAPKDLGGRIPVADRSRFKCALRPPSRN